MSEPMRIALAGDTELGILPALANRHGLITGATGTGKTVTLQVMAEAFSSIGVPVFMSDVKGDLTGVARAGATSPRFSERLDRLGLPEPEFRAFPVTLWDVFGEKGHPLRATVSDMGPLLLARMLGLNDTQEGVLHLVFRIADERGLLLLDAKDLRAMLQFVGENARQFTTGYGNVSAASIGAIQRGLLALDAQGADRFFGEPMLNLDDMMQTDASGRGVLNILAADRLMSAPRLYGAFLLWLLSELFENLPEVGDPDKPRFVFFFDEAHLLFNEAPRALLEKVEQVVRLIRSKGVGVYFVTQNPLDVPEAVLGQLGNRVQHALRAFTPRDQKAVKSAASTMRQNPAFDAEAAITELGVGEALVSFLDAKGRPSVVERAFVMPPASRIGPIDGAERADVMRRSVVAGIYEQPLDRESAYEKLAADAAAKAKAAEQEAAQAAARKEAEKAAPSGGGALGGILRGTGRKDSLLEAVAKSAARTIGSTIGREVIRGVLGSILRRR
ncbi:MAG TPA: helicase HerA-like domain-containing protein [Burkholderiaceae bacterium]